MEEQLPAPISELFILHLYLSSLTLVASIICLFLILKSNKLVSWEKYFLFFFGFLAIDIICSFLIWLWGPFKFDYMLGFVNIPTIVASIFLLSLIELRSKIVSQ
jgi:hypothetical protein